MLDLTLLHAQLDLQALKSQVKGLQLSEFTTKQREIRNFLCRPLRPGDRPWFTRYSCIPLQVPAWHISFTRISAPHSHCKAAFSMFRGLQDRMAPPGSSDEAVVHEQQYGQANQPGCRYIPQREFYNTFTVTPEIRYGQSCSAVPCSASTHRFCQNFRW